VITALNKNKSSEKVESSTPAAESPATPAATPKKKSK
jgi:hypothetical protein